MISIIRAEAVHETAILTARRELHFTLSHDLPNTLVEEECQKAFARGEKSGKNQGYEQAIKETSSLISLLQTLSNKLLEHKKILLEKIKPELIDFMIAVCERILRQKLANKETLHQLIQSLLEASSSEILGESVHIILAPADLEMLEDQLHTIHYDKRDLTHVSFRADPLMKRGDCRIETPSNLLNYSIDRQLNDLKSKVLHG